MKSVFAALPPKAKVVGRLASQGSSESCGLGFRVVNIASAEPRADRRYPRACSSTITNRCTL